MTMDRPVEAKCLPPEKRNIRECWAIQGVGLLACLYCRYQGTVECNGGAILARMKQEELFEPRDPGQGRTA